jgi:hypothetical protein
LGGGRVGNWPKAVPDRAAADPNRSAAESSLKRRLLPRIEPSLRKSSTIRRMVVDWNALLARWCARRRRAEVAGGRKALHGAPQVIKVEPGRLAPSRPGAAKERSYVTVLTRGEIAGTYAPPIEGEAAAEPRDGAMKNQTTRLQLGAAFVLAALLLAGIAVTALKATTSDAASAGRHGLDVLALDVLALDVLALDVLALDPAHE